MTYPEGLAVRTSVALIDDPVTLDDAAAHLHLAI
jgi:hypothetical protein